MATAASPVETNIISTSTTKPTDPTELTSSIKHTSSLNQPPLITATFVSNHEQQEDQEEAQQQRGEEAQQVTQSPESDSGKSSSCSPALFDCSFDSGIAVMDMDSVSLHNAQIKKRLQQCKRILLVLNRDQEVYRLLRDRLSKIAEKNKARKDVDDEQICIVCCKEINASDPKSYATCCMCKKRICRNNIKCGNWLPSNAQWECELCHSSKESLAQTSSWVAEQMSFNRQKFVYPMRARSEIYIPINDCNDSSMHLESVSQIGTNLAGISAEEKIKIREYVEELVANMLGGSLDQIQVGQMSKSENYLPAILNNGVSANTNTNTNNNNNNNNSNSNNDNNNNGSQNNDEPALIDISQTRLRQLIETIIGETLRSGVNTLTASSGAVSEITLDTRSNGDLSMLSNGGIKRRHRTEHYFEPKIYQDLLATAVLNKISDKEGNTRLFSESTPDLSARNIDENYNVEALSTTSGSSIEPRSDCSLTDHELVLNSDKIDSHTSLEAALDRESVLNDYIAAHMVPLPDISASVTESEDDIASMTSSMIGEGTWEDNWLFKKKRSGMPSSTTSSSMLVPAPKENIRAQIGDKTADEVSDLSEMGSDTDDSSLDLMRCNELNDRLLNKHLIGGHNTKLVLDELVDRSSMTSATLPVENELQIADTKNSLVIDSVLKTEAINGNLTNAHEEKVEAAAAAPPPMDFQDESTENEIPNPKADPIESDESIESIQSGGCVGYSLFEYIEDDNANENIRHEGIRAHIPSVIEILAAIALGPMLAVPASEQEGVMSHNEINTLKELSDLALAEINARTTELHHSLDVIEEESSEKDMSLSIVDAQCDLLSPDILPSQFNITNADTFMEMEETTLQSFDDAIPPPPPSIASIELQPDLSSICLEGIPPPNGELEELKSLEYMTFEAPLDFTSASAEDVTIAPIMDVLCEQPTATENVIKQFFTPCTPENHCCDPDEANVLSADEPVAIVDTINNATISANNTPTTTTLTEQQAVVSTEPTNNPWKVPSEVAATEEILHLPEVVTAPEISEAMEMQTEVATEISPSNENLTEASDIPPTVNHKVEGNEVGSVITEALSEVATTEVTEGTVTATEVATEIVPMEEPICELPKASHSQTEDSAEVAVVISIVENITEINSEPATVIEQSKVTLNEVGVEAIIIETNIAPSEIPVEPNPKLEASSELLQTSEAVAEICSDPKPVDGGEINTANEIKGELIIVSSDIGTQPNLIIESAPETLASIQTSTEMSTEHTEEVIESTVTSSVIVAVPVDTVATLSEVAAKPVILEATTITPSEDTAKPVIPEKTINPCEIVAEEIITVETPESMEITTELPTALAEENIELAGNTNDIPTVSVETEATIKSSISEPSANDSSTEALCEPTAVIDQSTVTSNKVEAEPDVPATAIIPVPNVETISELPEASDTIAEVCSKPPVIPSDLATGPISIMEASSDTLAETESAPIMEVEPRPLETADIPKEISSDLAAAVAEAADGPSNTAPDLVDNGTTVDPVITEETVADSEATLESEIDTAANSSAEPARMDNEVILQSSTASDTPAKLTSETETLDAESNDINSNATAEPVDSEAKVASNEVTDGSVQIMEALNEPPDISETPAENCCKSESFEIEAKESTSAEPMIVSENTDTPSKITAEPNAMEEVTSETLASLETLTEVLNESAEKSAEFTDNSGEIAIASVDSEAIVECSVVELPTKDNPTEVLTETEAEVAHPTTTQSEALVAEPVVSEATVTPSEIVVEPIPMMESVFVPPNTADVPAETEQTQIVEVVPEPLESTEMPLEVTSDPASVIAEETDVLSANTAPDSVETVATCDQVADSEVKKSDTVTEDFTELAAMDTEAEDAHVEVATELVPALEVVPQSSDTSDTPEKLSTETEVLDAEAKDINTAEPVVLESTVTLNEIISEPMQTKDVAPDPTKASSLVTSEISTDVSSDPPAEVAEATDVLKNTVLEFAHRETTAEPAEIAVESVPLVETSSKLQEADVGVIDIVSEFKTEPVIVSDETVTPKEVTAEPIPVVVESVVAANMETASEVSTEPAKESTTPDLFAKDNVTEAMLEPPVSEKPTDTPSIEGEPVTAEPIPKESETLGTLTEICCNPEAVNAETVVLSETTVTPSDVATEPNQAVAVISDILPYVETLANVPNEPTEEVNESIETSKIAAVPIDTEALPEPVEVSVQLTATLNEVAAEIVITETTITPSEVPGEPIPKVEASSELPQISDIVVAVSVTNPIDAISEQTAVIENPIASPSVEGEPLIPEAPLGPSDVAAEPVAKLEDACEVSQTSVTVAVPKGEAASELSHTLDDVAEICSEPEAVIVSENTEIPTEVASGTPTEVVNDLNAITEAICETTTSMETLTEVSTESAGKTGVQTDTSIEIAAVSVNALIAEPIGSLNEVSAESVIPETTSASSDAGGEIVPKEEAASEPEVVETAVIEAIVSSTASPTIELEPHKCKDIVAELVTEPETVVAQTTERPSEIEIEPILTEAIVTPGEITADLILPEVVSALPEHATTVVETIDIKEVPAAPISLVETVSEPANLTNTPEGTNTFIKVSTETFLITKPSSELSKTVDTLIEATTETTAVNSEATDTPIDDANDTLVTKETVLCSAVVTETNSLEAGPTVTVVDAIDNSIEITAESTETFSESSLVDAKAISTSDEVATDSISTVVDASEQNVTDIGQDKKTNPEAVVNEEMETPSEVTTETVVDEVAVMPSEITTEIVSEKEVNSEPQGTEVLEVAKATDIPCDNAPESGFEEVTVILVKSITESEVLDTEDTISEVIAERVPSVAKATNTLEELPSELSSTIDTTDIAAREPLLIASGALPSENDAKEVSVEPMTDTPTKVAAASVLLEATVMQSEPAAAEIAKATDVPSEIVIETDIAVESACKSPAVTEKFDNPVELIAAMDTASQQPVPTEAIDSCACCSNKTTDSIDDDAGLGKMTLKCLRRQPHVLDTTPSDDDNLAKPVNLFATICKFYIKDKRLLATIEGRRRKTLVMYRYLSSFDEDDGIEYDFHPGQNNNDHHQNAEVVVESITNEHESLLEHPKNEYKMNESPHELAQNTPLITENTLVLDEPMPELITDFSLEQSVFILDNLSEISFSFINAILFSDQISSDSSQSGESTATTTFETFDGDNEDESELTPTINYRTNIVLDTNYLKPTNTNSCTYTTNGILTNGSLRRSKKAKACAATLNGEHADDEIKDDDVALMRRFVPGSIAERECKKWYNAVDMPNNPYAPEALKQRISGRLERCMDVPNISPSTEPNPLTLMTDNTGEVNAEQSREPDYTRYSRDYYINEAQQTSAKCQSPTESRQSPSVDQSEATISANNEAQNVNKTTNEPMQPSQPSQPTQEQESSTRDSSCIYKALPAQVVVDEGNNNASSLETLSNQSLQSIQTTTSDDSETVRVYNFEKQETTILRGDSSAKNAKVSETTDTTSSSMESALSSPTKEVTPAKKRERPRALQFSGAANTGSDSSSALGSPKTPTRGSTPPAFKFLQPKRKLIEPSQVLSIDMDDEPVSTPSPEKVVIEHEVAHAMPSVKALAQAFLLTSKSTHAVRRWPTKPKKSINPETPTKPTTPTARKNLLESCVSVAEVADEATIASDLSSLETDPSINLDSEPKQSLAAINETQEEAAGKVSPVPVRAGFLRSNIAFFENLKFK